jgi:3-deoxy-7-phosphoheptulonate synthase
MSSNQIELSPLKLTSLASKPERTKIKVGTCVFGGDDIVIMAGPCAIESPEQYIATVDSIKKSGGHILRGSIYKPRTSPYSFQGLGDEALELLHYVRHTFQMPIITEAMDITQMEKLADIVDIVQIGARNMQNYSLLRAAGRLNKPILLKRGLSATINEWLFAAEYIMVEGNAQVILCERGIRTFETATRNTLDLSVIPIIKSLSHLPIVIDPSHATGKRALVELMSKAAVLTGADGLLIEVHQNPEKALSDGDQSINHQEFKHLVDELQPITSLRKEKIKCSR